MKRSHATFTIVLALCAGTAFASPPPTPAARGNVNGIDVAISASGAGPSGSKDVAVYTTTVGLPTPTTDYFCMSLGTTSCNPQPNNGPPSLLYPLGTPGIVAGSQLEMGDWIRMWEVANGRNNVSLGTAAGDRHPYIVGAVYRINNEGRLEQLSNSWAKHSFSAASSSQSTIGGANGQPACGTGTCSSFASDNELEANCADTYGSGLNSSASYLGPKHEIAVNGGMNTPGWTYRNSWFDNYTTTGSGSTLQHVLAATAQRNDGIRSFNASTIKAYQLMTVRRDEVNAAALGTAGRLYCEGMYVVNGDAYYYNNVAHRRYTSTVTTTATPTSSNINFDGPHTWGPVVLTWGDTKAVADPRTDGDMLVSSRVVDIGGGMWRYEYNVYNLNFERQVDAVEIPVTPGATTMNHNFFQPRQFWPTYETANWNQTYDGTKKSIVWAASAAAALDDTALAALNPPLPAGTVMNKNSIRWGTMYTFWYTATTPPRTALQMMKLNPYRAGSFTEMMTAEVKVPRHPADLASAGGQPGDDGELDNNDFIVYVNYFFQNNPLADIGVQGGVAGHDGVLDNNDFAVFVNVFFNN